MNSNNWMFAGLLMVIMFGAGCVVTPERQVRTVVYAPPLPSVVVFETEPYYVYQGYHYHYQHDRWYYSHSRSGPWTSLPRDCYPREVRYRDRGPQIVIAPPLPPLVVFETEPYYVHQGYHYHYQNNGWYYSRSKSGPWTSLPRDRYPKEVHYRDGRHGDDKGRGPHVSQPIPEHRERVQPLQEHKSPAMPPPKYPVKVQPTKEGKVVLTQPVVHPTGVVTPSVGSKTQHLERAQGQKQTSFGRSGKTKINEKKPLRKPEDEGKDNEIHEQDGSKGP